MITLTENICKWLGAVDRIHPRLKGPKRRGRPCVYSDTVLLRCYLLMLLHPRLRSYAALHAFLGQHATVRTLVGLERVPHRSTLSRRLPAMVAALRGRIWAMGLSFIWSGYVQLHILMADGSLHQASGWPWPMKYQRQGVLPQRFRHVDRYAGWGKSPYRGWVWGYRSHPVLALNADLEPIPILADAHPANVQDNTILAEQLPWLPQEATVLLLDSNYEDKDLCDDWQRRDEQGMWERWLVLEPKRRRGQPAAWRQALQVRRYVEEPDLYKLRGALMEPFFAHWKEAFDLAVVPLQGKAAPAFLLLALYGYQLLIWHNLRTGRPTYAYKHLILGLD